MSNKIPTGKSKIDETKAEQEKPKSENNSWKQKREFWLKNEEETKTMRKEESKTQQRRKKGNTVGEWWDEGRLDLCVACVWDEGRGNAHGNKWSKAKIHVSTNEARPKWHGATKD